MNKFFSSVSVLVILASYLACSDIDKAETGSLPEVIADGVSAKVYETLVSKAPTNKYWDGKQRDSIEAETAFFTIFDYKKDETVQIKLPQDIRGKKCVVRPLSLGIGATVKKNGTISLSGIPGPCQFVVEVGGYHNALHVFVNSAEAYKDIDTKSPDVIYYGPGKHDCGKITLQSGQTLFIDEGATVYGYVCSRGTSDVKIVGKGILDCSKMTRAQGNAILLNDVENAEICGITINDPAQWTALVANCSDVLFDNVKVIGAWRYNADGFDVCNTSNVNIYNCFLRCFDDNIVIKGLSSYCKAGYSIVENVDVKNCVLWNDWGHALEIGAETVADEICNVHYDSCRIIHYTFDAVDIQNTDRAHVHDIHYSNIYAEEPIYLGAKLCDEPMNTEGFGGLINITETPTIYSTTQTCGKVTDITYENIHYDGTHSTWINFAGYAENAYVKDIKIRNCYINGEKIGSNYGYNKNKFVSNVTIE